MADADAHAARGEGAPHVDATSVVPPLFEQSKVRKPEYWQFARLIAPSATLPPGQKQWTVDDAVGIWCLRCQKAMVFQKGSSQSIRYHMESKHRAELEQLREQYKDNAAVRTPSNNPKKRRASAADAEDEDEMEAAPSPASAHANAAPASTASMEAPEAVHAHSWRQNLDGHAGFWANAYWYDFQIERRMPLVPKMMDEMIAALPPCDGARVLDLCAGSGRAALALLKAYPTAHVTLVDASKERLRLAQERLMEEGIRLADEEFVAAFITPSTLPSLCATPLDLVTGCLANHVLAEHPAHYEHLRTSASTTDATMQSMSIEMTYQLLFRAVFLALKPGGHFIFGDHVRQVPMFQQLRLLESVGFSDVDCAWRQSALFVAGARKPLT